MIVLKSISGFLRYLKKKLKSNTVYDGLHPYFDQQEIDRYTRYYVPQYFQNIAPSEGDEPGKIHAAAARSKLMPQFLKKDLRGNSPIKYFIILADTGMGKTAFLINLHNRYIESREKINRVKHEIRLIPLGANGALEKIRKIPEKANVILLLDAFDEDVLAVLDYKNRMNEILEAVSEFRKVVFTCRTHFFPTMSEEPYETNDFTFGENKRYKIHKVYLSAFDDRVDKPIALTLLRQFSFFS